ncbi:MAG: hypothetical protein AAGF84_08905 [Planctomycetota bacterium]
MNDYPNDPWATPSYSEPGGGGTAPGVVGWFKVYNIVFCVMYFAVAGFGLWMLSSPQTFIDASAGAASNAPSNLTEAKIMGWIYGGLGIVFFGAYVGWWLVSRSGAKWVYGIVLICIGMLSFCTLPAAIPLLIFWIRDDCKAWFRGAPAAADPFREPWD